MTTRGTYATDDDCAADACKHHRVRNELVTQLPTSHFAASTHHLVGHTQSAHGSQPQQRARRGERDPRSNSIHYWWHMTRPYLETARRSPSRSLAVVLTRRLPLCVYQLPRIRAHLNSL